MQKYILLFTTLFMACDSNISAKKIITKDTEGSSTIGSKMINIAGTTIAERFETPIGFIRKKVSENTISNYTRNLPLKKWGSPVLYFNGTEKTKQNVYCSVIDMPIGNKDLHQCADAVMNIWANYLYSQKRYNDIQFHFLGDYVWHNFAAWSGGNYSQKNFTKYMEQVWSAANTRSLFGQLHAIQKSEVCIGDVLIVTGKPYGHAMMIVDECVHEKTGKKMYMLAQSYMPAQEMQILINPNSDTKSVWYSFDESNDIITPEWDFTINDFRRF
jgi:Domain of unknown function (4846)